MIRIGLLILTLLLSGCYDLSVNILTSDTDSFEVYCGSKDLRIESSNGIVPVTEDISREIGDIFWVAILIKQSHLLDDSNSSDRIGVYYDTNRFELIQDGLIVYPYNVENEYVISFHKLHHILLEEVVINDKTYRYVILRFVYKSHTENGAAMTFNYLHKTTNMALPSDSGLFINNTGRVYKPIPPERYIGKIIPDEYCHPKNWDTIPHEGEYFQPMDRCFNDEEWNLIINARTHEDRKLITEEIIKQYWIDKNSN